MKKKPRSVTVTVTARDIAKGEPRSGHYCPVSLACRRALRRRVFVGYAAVQELSDGDVPGTIAFLPLKEQDRIAIFDNDKGMRPHKFTLRLPA